MNGKIYHGNGIVSNHYSLAASEYAHFQGIFLI